MKPVYSTRIPGNVCVYVQELTCFLEYPSPPQFGFAGRRCRSILLSAMPHELVAHQSLTILITKHFKLQNTLSVILRLPFYKDSYSYQLVNALKHKESASIMNKQFINTVCLFLFNSLNITVIMYFVLIHDKKNKMYHPFDKIFEVVS